MIYGAVGNARLYLIRDDIVREKSRDDSIAHLAEKQINWITKR